MKAISHLDNFVFSKFHQEKGFIEKDTLVLLLKMQLTVSKVLVLGGCLEDWLKRSKSESWQSRQRFRLWQKQRRARCLWVPAWCTVTPDLIHSESSWSLGLTPVDGWEGWQEGCATFSFHRHLQKHNALEHVQRYVHQCHESWISEALGRVSKNAYCAWPQRVRQSIYRGKCSTHDFKTQARNISQHCIEGALTWVYPCQALTGLKKKKVYNMQTGTFLA